MARIKITILASELKSIAYEMRNAITWAKEKKNIETLKPSLVNLQLIQARVYAKTQYLGRLGSKLARETSRTEMEVTTLINQALSAKDFESMRSIVERIQGKHGHVCRQIENLYFQNLYAEQGKPRGFVKIFGGTGIK